MTCKKFKAFYSYVIIYQTILTFQREYIWNLIALISKASIKLRAKHTCACTCTPDIGHFTFAHIIFVTLFLHSREIHFYIKLFFP